MNIITDQFDIPPEDEWINTPKTQKYCRDSKYSVSIFEHTGKPIEYEGSKALDPHNRTFISLFARGARDDNIHLKGCVHSLPFSLDHIHDEKFDADFALCLYRNIYQVGPELALLIARERNRYHHIFVITQQHSPDDSETVKQLSTIVPNTYRGIRLVDLPYPEDYIDPETDEKEETYNAEEADLLSFWGINDIRDPDIRKQILTRLSI